MSFLIIIPEPICHSDCISFNWLSVVIAFANDDLILCTMDLYEVMTCIILLAISYILSADKDKVQTQILT